jgi:hypothetical protein
MEWQNALPYLNAWIPNISHNFPVFPTTNTFNPYRSVYGNSLSEQTRLGISQINAQLLYNLRLASGSTTYTGSQPSQNEREIENQHLYSSQTHQNLSGLQELLIPDQNLYRRQRLQIPDTSFSSFNPPEFMPGVVILTAQRNQKSGNDRPHGLANGPMTYSGTQPLQNHRQRNITISTCFQITSN